MTSGKGVLLALTSLFFNFHFEVPLPNRFAMGLGSCFKVSIQRAENNITSILLLTP